MIYLIGKIVLSLLAALGIGFGMAWALQMHLAARLREQLNSVIFETKSRIPQLESEITNRDQVIDGLREDLAKKPKEAPPTNQPGSKEQEKQIDELRQQVIDLETELKAAKGVTHDESVLELDDEDRVHTEEPELMSDDEFLADIQDIFDDADGSVEAFGDSDPGADNAAPAQSTTTKKPANTKKPSQPKQPTEKEVHNNVEDELQSELENWDDSAADSESKADAKKNSANTDDLKAELLDLDKGADDDSTSEPSDFDALRGEVESLNESRKELNDIVDSQAKEMSSMRQQRELQDKSLSVLNQQLELARMANERILRELRDVKDGNTTPKTSEEDQPRSANGG